MKSTLYCLVFAGALVVVGEAAAHGIPIYLSVDNGRLQTNTNIYTSTLETIPGVDHETEYPGISVASSASKVPNGTALSFNVIDNLFYWDGSKLAPTSATLTFENALSKSVSVTQNTIYENGPLFGTYNGTTGWHEHGYYMLNIAAPVGAYGLVVSFAASGLSSSDPVLLVFNRGLNSVQFDAGVKAIAATQFGLPGDINLDGRVDGADYVIWANHFKKPGTLSEGDLTRDGKVDGADYLIWANHYTGVKSAAIPVPEPSGAGLALVVTAFAGIAAWRRRNGV
jgi:hypothetical protein